MSDGARTFWREAGRILNACQSRAIVLSGNIHDLYDDGAAPPGDYVSLIDLLSAKWNVPSWIGVVYEINGPIRFVRDEDREKVKRAWLQWRTGLDADSLAVKRMIAPSRTRPDFDAIGRRVTQPKLIRLSRSARTPDAIGR